MCERYGTEPSSLFIYLRLKARTHRDEFCVRYSPRFFVFFFCTSYCFFAHLVVFLHISLSFAHLIVFCTSYCFALFYFIAHFILISPFLTICMPLCYVTYIICILIVLHCHWADLIRLHFTSSYALYNYYVTNKETLRFNASWLKKGRQCECAHWRVKA